MIGITQYGLSLYYGSNEYVKLTSVSLAAAYYYSLQPKGFINKAGLLKMVGIFGFFIITLHEMRRTFNGYYGVEPLQKFISKTTHNPYIRYLLDVKLGITDFFFPNFYGVSKDDSLYLEQSIAGTLVTREQIQQIETKDVDDVFPSKKLF